MEETELICGDKIGITELRIDTITDSFRGLVDEVKHLCENAEKFRKSAEYCIKCSKRRRWRNGLRKRR